MMVTGVKPLPETDYDLLASTPPIPVPDADTKEFKVEEKTLLDPEVFWPDGKLGRLVDKLEESKRPNIYLAMVGFESCPACKDMGPVADDLRKKGYAICYWDVEKHPHLHKMLGVRYGYPHFTMVVNGRIWQQCDGKIIKDSIIAWFEYANELAEGKSVREGKPETNYAAPGQFNRLIPPKPDHE